MRNLWVRPGKRSFETFNRKGDADNRAAKIKVELGKGTHVALDSKTTVADTAEIWIRWRPKVGSGRRSFHTANSSGCTSCRSSVASGSPS